MTYNILQETKLKALKQYYLLHQKSFIWSPDSVLFMQSKNLPLRPQHCNIYFIEILIFEALTMCYLLQPKTYLWGPDCVLLIANKKLSLRPWLCITYCNQRLVFEALTVYYLLQPKTYLIEALTVYNLLQPKTYMYLWGPHCVLLIATKPCLWSADSLLFVTSTDMCLRTW